MKKNILLLILSLLVFLALCEGAARLYTYVRGGDNVRADLTYEPFVMFSRGQPWDSTFPPREPGVRNKAKGIRHILLLGGSTAAMFPSHILEKAMTDRFPGNRFRVVNAGAHGYTVRQELIVASIWGATSEPDLVISLDGYNDLFYYITERAPAGSFFLQSTYKVYVTKPFMAPVVWLLSHSRAYLLIANLTARVRKPRPIAEYRSVNPFFLNDQHGMNVIAKGLSATRLMVLQPVIYLKTPLSGEEMKYSRYISKSRQPLMVDLYGDLYAGMKDLSEKDRVFFMDGRFIFEGQKKTVFYDDCHLNEDGYRILAENIADCLRGNGFGAHLR